MARKKQEEISVQKDYIRQTVEDVFSTRFETYAREMIPDRSLPDARDGLKPVQRRILYAMYHEGNTASKPYRKSAKTVGLVIGNYHPHGDSSVYEAMVRLSQDWKMRKTLVDMQGNNGSIDDDPAAAMRYTEARLSESAEYLLKDLDQDTVEYTYNFDDTELEPTVLPSAFPNLLVNGSKGMAIGYATNMPPHNLKEVIQAAIYRLNHPDCSLEELMEIVKGPDFPTGGIVMGKEGIRDMYEKGQGRFIIRSKVDVIESKTDNKIVISEIPYDVVKSDLVKQIDDIRLSKDV
jgi:topoisomerase-4 subunit A